MAIGVMHGFSADSIGQFLVKGISFSSSEMFVYSLLVIPMGVDHKRAANIPDTTQCLL